MTLKEVRFSVGDVTAKGLRVRVSLAGDGPPLLLVHDLLDSRLTWDGILLPLAETLRVGAFDLPGFGESEKPPPEHYDYGYSRLAESVIDVGAAAGFGRMALAGHGVGAAIALLAAANHPEMVRSLIMLSPSVFPDGGPDLLTRLARTPLLGPLVLRQLAGRRMHQRHLAAGRHQSRAVLTERAALLYRQFDSPEGRGAALSALRATVDRRPIEAALGRTTVPALILGGQDEGQVSCEQYRKVARRLSARLMFVHSGRAPHEEAPREVVRTVLDFLATDGARA